jgi:hypothetical protein
MTMSNKVMGIALSMTLLASIAGAVWAATTTNSPGAYCVASSGTLSVRDDGEVENTTASTVTVVCPAERPISPSATTKVSGTVFVVDRSSAGDVCCKIMSKNAGGSLVQNASPACSAGSSTAYQQLPLPQITDAATFSQYFVQCTLPPVNAGAASRIQLYRTTQE